jgi:alpha-mannosidase
MTNQKYWVVGNTHIDLAWKKNRQEMAELLDIFIARVLDMLDSHPTFTYTIEQAAHYRLLKERRPDLFARIKRYVQEGRLEMVGGMASTLETNIPNGESFVRNQFLGLKWVKEHLEADVRTPWLIDTFGLHAQLPQVLRQFGFNRLMANRFGGNKNHDVFLAEGLDGSTMLVAGRDVYSPLVNEEHVIWRTANNWEAVDQLYTAARKTVGTGPFLVTAYTENEVLPSLRSDIHINRANEAEGEETWQYGTLSSFFDALEATNKEWPVLSADLNPEFTGTFSLRTIIRLRNRTAENLLLEAEKWSALLGLTAVKTQLEEAWWELAYIQFHDVFTGSHPTNVFRDVLESLDGVQRSAADIIDRALRVQDRATTPAVGQTFVKVTNGLPWPRR